MTRDESTAIARKLCAVFPGNTIPAVEWAEAIIDLDAGTAGTTLIRLTHELDKPPTIAQFRRRYSELRTRVTDPTRPCETCDGNGWIQTDDLVHIDGRHTSQVQPCPTCSTRSAV